MDEIVPDTKNGQLIDFHCNSYVREALQLIDCYINWLQMTLNWLLMIMKCNVNYFNIADNYIHFADIQCGTTLRRNSIKDSKTVYKEWEKNNHKWKRRCKTWQTTFNMNSFEEVGNESNGDHKYKGWHKGHRNCIKSGTNEQRKQKDST